MRKRLDLTRPVAPEIIEECLAIALQALNDRERAIVVGRWLSDRRVRLARFKLPVMACRSG